MCVHACERDGEGDGGVISIRDVVCVCVCVCVCACVYVSVCVMALVQTLPCADLTPSHQPITLTPGAPDRQ